MKKLKKGSKEAKMFMAKLRASRGKKKAVKKKLNGKKHTDIKSHNYRINIGASGDYAKFELSTIKALAKLLKQSIKQTSKIVNENTNLLNVISESFENKKTPLQTARLLKDILVPKKQIKPIDAFVNLLSKKGKQQSTGQKANFPMKLPATVTIGNLQQNLVDQLKHKIIMLKSWEKVLKTLQENLKLEKNTLNKTLYRNDIYRTKNVIKNLKTEIKNLKRTI